MEIITAYGASLGERNSLTIVAVLKDSRGRYKVPMWSVGSTLPADVTESSVLFYESEEAAFSVFDTLVGMMRIARREAGVTA